eukprot:764523-Hanusia_phi.AAC.2
MEEEDRQGEEAVEQYPERRRGYEGRAERREKRADKKRLAFEDDAVGGSILGGVEKLLVAKELNKPERGCKMTVIRARGERGERGERREERGEREERRGEVR